RLSPDCHSARLEAGNPRKMRGCNMTRLAALCLALAIAPCAHAQTIYPLNRAEILAGSRFDLKVDFPGAPQRGAVRVTINGKDAAEAAGKAATFAEREDGGEHSAYWIREVSLAAPGNYVVEATAGDKTARVNWEVFAPESPKAK